jgi:chemosensory pili system protein ChpA (sensor histidine kinase/response regulator)
MVVAHQVVYAVPSALIQKVISLKFVELTQAYQQGFLQVDNVNYSFAHLTQLMGEKMNTLPQSTALVLLLSNGNATAAVHIDSIQSNVEAVVKPLSPLMRRTPGLISATLLSDGKLCLIVDPIQLLQAYIHTALINNSPIQTSDNKLAFPLNDLTAITQPLIQDTNTQSTDTIISVETKKSLPRLVMVVDDSLTVRKVTQKLLLREGWEVLLAKDGIDALEQLQTVQPTLMIVDIEMPRMDGFDLTRNIRAETRLMHIPIIMITSRIADKHREYATGLGVNVYMGKPYHDEVLLAAMAKLII